MGALLALLSACDPIPVGSGCGPANCGGCCSEAGACLDGSAKDACGGNGLACRACGTGTCTAQACVGGPGPDGGTLDAGSGGTVTTGAFSVQGRVTFDFVPALYDERVGDGRLDFAAAVERPARRVAVQVLEGTTVLASTTTGDDGRYAATGTGSGSASIQVVVVARSSEPTIEIKDNTDGDRTWALGVPMPAGGGTVDVHATHGWTGSAYDPARRTAAPFAVLDAMYTAARAFMDVRPLHFPALTVFWSPRNQPQSGSLAQGKIGTSFFAPDEVAIYVLGQDGVDTDEYDDHVIVHEWGHFFEATQSRSESPGGNHSDGDVLDPRVSWSEGFGDAMPALVLGRTMYVDTSFNGGAQTAFGFDAETPPSPTDDPTPGVFSEATVMRLLYDAFDATNEGSFDRVTLGLGPLADLLTGPVKSTTALASLGPWAVGLRHLPGVPVADADALLAHYGVGPLTSDFGDGDAPLRGIYTPAATLPFGTTVNLDGRLDSNMRAQNQYFVLTGTGRSLAVTAQSSRDVGLEVYRAGAYVTGADATTSGTESLSFQSQLGTTYVLVLTGYASVSGNYPATVSVKSP